MSPARKLSPSVILVMVNTSLCPISDAGTAKGTRDNNPIRNRVIRRLWRVKKGMRSRQAEIIKSGLQFFR